MGAIGEEGVGGSLEGEVAKEKQSRDEGDGEGNEREGESEERGTRFELDCGD